jgi:nitroreductase
VELWEAIRRRRAVRDYAAEPIAKRVLEEIIVAASWAPSAMNRQPWLFTVVQDPPLLDRISREAKAHLLDAANAELPPELLDRLKDPAFHIFYRAPALVVIASALAGSWAIEDCALAAENLMLAACAKGLGSCWIGLAQGWLCTPGGKRALGLPDACAPIAPIILGYPETVPEAPHRVPPRVRWMGRT